MILLEPNTAGLWDADSLDTMLDYVLENFPEIDKDRVYVMGYSMGGKGTWVWINESADRFAAAAPCGFRGCEETCEVADLGDGGRSRWRPNNRRQKDGGTVEGGGEFERETYGV
jgi:pimeloyl-ACP methyl ester carboxylesterase